MSTFRTKRRNRRSLPTKRYKDVSAFIIVTSSLKEAKYFSAYGSRSGLQRIGNYGHPTSQNSSNLSEGSSEDPDRDQLVPSS